MNQYVSTKLPPVTDSAVSAVSLILLLTCTGLTPFSQAAIFKVALLPPGAISDVGWNVLAYDGLKAVEKELSVKKVNHIESKTPAQWEEHFCFFASKGLKQVTSKHLSPIPRGGIR